MCSSLGRHYRAGQSSHQFLNRGNRKMQKRGKALKTKPGQPAESFRTCKLESTKELARSWFRIRLRHISMDKVSRMRAGQKGFPTVTQNDCETPPTERSYSYPGWLSR